MKRATQQRNVNCRVLYCKTLYFSSMVFNLNASTPQFSDGLVFQLLYYFQVADFHFTLEKRKTDNTHNKTTHHGELKHFMTETKKFVFVDYIVCPLKLCLASDLI